VSLTSDFAAHAGTVNWYTNVESEKSDDEAHLITLHNADYFE